MRPAGNQTSSNFFQSATVNRLALVPAAGMLASYGNRSLGAGAAAQYNSLVKASQQNGAGPNMPPIKAPFSITQFGTGLRTLRSQVSKRLKGKS